MIVDAAAEMVKLAPAVFPAEWKAAADDIISAISTRYLRSGFAFHRACVVNIPYAPIAADVYSAVPIAIENAREDEIEEDDHEPGCLCKHEHILMASIYRVAQVQNLCAATCDRLFDMNMDLLTEYIGERS